MPRLSPGEKVRFQLNGLYYDKQTKRLVCPNSKALVPTDRIYDPWAEYDEKTKEYTGAYVDLAYILRERPAGDDSQRDSLIELGRIEFKRSDAGVIEVIGGNLEKEKMYPFLFFNNRNAANAGKPWHVKPNGSYVYTLMDKGMKSKQTLKTELMKDKAKDIVMKMSDEELDSAASGLFPSTYARMEKEEKVLALRDIAIKDPKKIMDLSQNIDVQTTAFIEECLVAGIIEQDKNKQNFIWPDDKMVICTIKPGQTPHTSLKRFFMTPEGVEVLSALERQLELSKKSKKDKTTKAAV